MESCGHHRAERGFDPAPRATEPHRRWSAFAALVEAHQSAVFGTVLRLVFDREVATELSNGAFFKAYEHLASFDDSRPLRAWLLRIAANEAQSPPR
jgi:DNA-directed RNA polymerase specialized sigma24 family protein